MLQPDSHLQLQYALEPPILRSKVASSWWPSALVLHLSLVCLHPPWVQQYLLVRQRFLVASSGVLGLEPGLGSRFGCSLPCLISAQSSLRSFRISNCTVSKEV